MKIIKISLLTIILILDDNHSGYQVIPVNFYNVLILHTMYAIYWIKTGRIIFLL